MSWNNGIDVRYRHAIQESMPPLDPPSIKIMNGRRRSSEEKRSLTLSFFDDLSFGLSGRIASTWRYRVSVIAGEISVRKLSARERQATIVLAFHGPRPRHLAAENLYLTFLPRRSRRSLEHDEWLVATMVAGFCSLLSRVTVLTKFRNVLYCNTETCDTCISLFDYARDWKYRGCEYSDSLKVHAYWTRIFMCIFYLLYIMLSYILRLTF